MTRTEKRKTEASEREKWMVFYRVAPVHVFIQFGGFFLSSFAFIAWAMNTNQDMGQMLALWRAWNNTEVNKMTNDFIFKILSNLFIIQIECFNVNVWQTSKFIDASKSINSIHKLNEQFKCAIKILWKLLRHFFEATHSKSDYKMHRNASATNQEASANAKCVGAS